MIALIITAILCTLILSVCIVVSIHSFATVLKQKPVYNYEWKKMARDFNMQEYHLVPTKLEPDEDQSEYLFI